MATTNFGWTTPVVGGDFNAWGTKLNDQTFEEMDTDVFTIQTTANAAMPLAGGVFTGNISIFTSVQPTVDLGNISGVVDIDLTNGEFFYATLTGNATINIINWQAGTDFQACALELTNGGEFTITWGAPIKWDNDTDPTLRDPGINLLMFGSRDAGTRIFANDSHGSTT